MNFIPHLSPLRIVSLIATGSLCGAAYAGYTLPKNVSTTGWYDYEEHIRKAKFIDHVGHVAFYSIMGGICMPVLVLSLPVTVPIATVAGTAQLIKRTTQSAQNTQTMSADALVVRPHRPEPPPSNLFLFSKQSAQNTQSTQSAQNTQSTQSAHSTQNTQNTRHEEHT